MLKVLDKKKKFLQKEIKVRVQLFNIMINNN